MVKALTPHIFDSVRRSEYVLFSWIFNFIRRSANSDMNVVKSQECSVNEKSRVNQSRLRNIKNSNSFILHLLKVYWKEYLLVVCAKLIFIIQSFIDSLYTLRLTKLMDPANRAANGSNKELSEIVRDTMIILIGNNITKSFVLCHLSLFTARLSYRIRSGVTFEIYRKMLKTSNSSYEKYTPGRITSMLQVDMENIGSLMMASDSFLQALSSIIIVIIIYTNILGWSQIIVYVFLGAMIIVVGALGAIKNYLMKEYMSKKDERLEFLKSILNNIHTIKQKAYETLYIYRLEEKRRKELKRLWEMFIVSSFLMCSPLFATMTTPQLLCLFGLITNSPSINKQSLLTFMIYFNIFFSGITSIFDLISQLSECFVSIRRIEEFLKSREISCKPKALASKEYSVLIEECTFSLTPKHLEADFETPQIHENFELSIDSLKIGRGEFTIILGENGAGKSLLLQSLMGELEAQIKGRFEVEQDLSFSSQNPWIFNQTIKDNILFGSKFNEKLLGQCLRLSQLSYDIEQMENGIETQCEEDGANLSGGQRARISLARAFYSQSQLILLDDPFRALDPNVAKDIIEQGIGSRNNTVIMTTNNFSHAGYADRIILLHKGEIVANGDPEEIKDHPLLRNKIPSIKKVSPQKNKIVKLKQEEDRSNTDSIDNSGDDKVNTEGRVSLKLIINVMKQYGSYWGMPLIICINISAFYFYSNVFTGNMNIINGYDDSNDSKPLIIMNLIKSFLSITILIISMIMLFTLGIHSSRKLHRRMTFSILHSKIAEFLDITPIGTILNRFTNDLDCVDRRLPSGLFYMILPSFLFMFALKSYVTGMKSLIAISLLCLFTSLVLISQNSFLKANNNLLRLLNSAKSPLNQMATRIATGVVEIRAMRREKYISDICFNSIDEVVKYSLLQSSISIGYYLYVTWANYLILTIPGFVYIYSEVSKGDKSSTDLVTMFLFLNNINTIGESLLGLVNIYNGIESLFVNVERCKEYEDLPIEIGYKNLGDLKHATHLSSWEEVIDHYRNYQLNALESNGEIIFDNFSARYPNQNQLVLKGLSLKIEPGQKIGVIGRTGSGKSSFAKALWRGLEAEEGSIKIDECTISDLDVQEHRKHLSVTTQETSLIGGSILDNISPFILDNVIKNPNI